MMRVLAIVCLCASAAMAQPAPADDAGERSRAADAEGKVLFEQDNFSAAIAKFTEAYELLNDPAYLFNIAQAYRLMGDCENSAVYYKRFLDDVPHPPNEDKIRAWYVSQLECVNAKAKRAPSPAPAPVPVAPQPTTSSTSGKRIAAYALAGTSLVAFGVGGYFLWDAGNLRDARDERLAGCTMLDPCDAGPIDDYDRRGSRANILSIVGFAAGGAALAGAVALFVLDRRERTETPIAITPLPGGAMFAGGIAW
jgi:tetratricopeptide (TPR) repeat protein